MLCFYLSEVIEAFWAPYYRPCRGATCEIPHEGASSQHRMHNLLVAGSTAMRRSLRALSPAHRTSGALDAFVAPADGLHQPPREPCTMRLPTAPSRWRSPSACTPCPLVLTREGDGEGGRRGRVGAPLDCRVPRSLCAPHEGRRGGRGDAPARLGGVAVAASLAQDSDAAPGGADLHPAATGHRARALAGLHDHVPGQEDGWPVRSRGGDAVRHKTIAVVGGRLRPCGRSNGAGLAPAGPRAPSSARSQGCPSAGAGCHACRIDEAGRQAVRGQGPRRAPRLQRPCPWPAVVHTGREATAPHGNPHAPTVSRLARADGAPGAASRAARQLGAPRLGLSHDEVPPGRRAGCHLRRGPPGALRGHGPPVPSDRAAPGGSHGDNQHPSPHAAVLGDVPRPPPARNDALGLAVPLGPAPDPADAPAGTAGLAHRTARAMPVRPGPRPLGDAAPDVLAPALWRHDRGGIAVCAAPPRPAPRAPASLVTRGDAPSGTPAAPGGRLWRSPGYDDHAASRQEVGGRPGPPPAPRPCPHGAGGLGERHRRTCQEPPRRRGPLPRGTPAWQRRAAARSARARTNRAAQAGIANAPPLRMRGLKAWRGAGASRPLAQRFRRALPCVREVPSPLGKASVAPTCPPRLCDHGPWTAAGASLPGGQGQRASLCGLHHPVEPQATWDTCETRECFNDLLSVENTNHLRIATWASGDRLKIGP